MESYGCLGGTLTIVTLGGFCGIHAVVDDERLGRVVGGLCLELEDRLAKVDAIRPPKRHGRIVGVPYDSVRFKGVADEMLEARGVAVMLHTHAVAVMTEGARVAAVIVENKGGRSASAPLRNCSSVCKESNLKSTRVAPKACAAVVAHHGTGIAHNAASTLTP